MTVPLLALNVEKLREDELEEARAIQGVMLPTEPLRTGAVRISHAFQPVAAVGGDFLDYFELPDGTIGLYLGDVSGKGLAAAMYAALAVGTLRGVHKTNQSAFHGARKPESQIASSGYTSPLQRRAICDF